MLTNNIKVEENPFDSESIFHSFQQKKRKVERATKNIESRSSMRKNNNLRKSSVTNGTATVSDSDSQSNAESDFNVIRDINDIDDVMGTLQAASGIQVGNKTNTRDELLIKCK